VSVLDELKSKPWFPWAVGAGVIVFLSGFSSDPQRRPFDMSFKATAANDGYSFKVHSNLQATDGCHA
jgi:hypothetical protein